MKGKLLKTNSGWIVNYIEKSTKKGIQKKVNLPLHPENEIYCFDSDSGKEINFEIYAVSKTKHFGMYQSTTISYAKLIRPSEENLEFVTSNMVSEDFVSDSEIKKAAEDYASTQFNKISEKKEWKDAVSGWKEACKWYKNQLNENNSR